MKRCKYCSSNDLVKNCKPEGFQRYRCKSCGKNQIEGDKRIKYSNDLRRLAVCMYLNNSGFRAIGRVLDVDFQLVHHWIKKAGTIVEEEVAKIKDEHRKIAILEMDELYSFVEKKQWQLRVWLAVDRDRNEVAAYHVGNGHGWNAKKLIDKVKHHDIGIVATDGNYAYGRYLPKKIKHIITKSETCLVEAKNSSLRDMIARFNRRTMCK